MKNIKTYPEMNEKIKELLAIGSSDMDKYILARIEELEKENKILKKSLEGLCQSDFKEF